jgi:hypothetical protein
MTTPQLPELTSDAPRRIGLHRYSVAQFLIALVVVFIGIPFVEQFDKDKHIDAILMTLVLVSGVLALYHALHRRLRRHHPGVSRGADAGGDGSHHRHALRGGAHLPVGGALFIRETSVRYAEALILTQIKVVTMNPITPNIEPQKANEVEGSLRYDDR